jgi:hypothetical protein
MREGVGACHVCLQRGIKEWHEALPLVYRHTGESLAHARAGLQARARATSQRGGLRASEASWTMNRDQLTCRDLSRPAGGPQASQQRRSDCAPRRQ